MLNSSSQSNDIPSNAISLYYGGDDILCAISNDKYKELINCLVKKDDIGWNELFANGEAFTISSNTRAIVLDYKLSTAKVRISEGLYKDQIAWVAIEAVGK